MSETVDFCVGISVSVSEPLQPCHAGNCTQLFFAPAPFLYKPKYQNCKRVTNIKSYLVFKVLFLQVLHICDHLMDDWIEHGLGKTIVDNS